MIYKTTLITGASAGIGKAIALAAAKQKMKLVLVARREDRLKSLQQQVGADIPVHIMACDLTDLDEVKMKLASLPGEFSEIDVLVNNAGLALGLGGGHEVAWEDWSVMIDTNCKALSFLINRLLPGMVQRNCGHVINLGSVAGNYPYPGGNMYAATKAFVEELTLNLKADLVGTAVRVSNIEPGLVGGSSEFSLVRNRGDQQSVDKARKGFEALQPEDIAEIVMWIVNQPAHVNINRVEVMSVAQAPGRMIYHKSE